MRDLFEEEIVSIDPTFFERLEWSWVHPDDAQNKQHHYGGLLFPDAAKNKAFLKRYPTIYHLRDTLAKDTDQHDIREIYLAIHHIIKFRGNFLRSGEISSKNLFNISDLETLLREFSEITSGIDEDTFAVSSSGLTNALTSPGGTPSKRAEDALEAIDLSKVDKQQKRDLTKLFKQIFKSLTGNMLDILGLFGIPKTSVKDETLFKFRFTDADAEDKILSVIDTGDLTNDQTDLLQKLYEQFNSIELKRLIGNSISISEAKIESYKNHKNAWKLIKHNLRRKMSAKKKKELNNHYLAYLKNNEDSRRTAQKYFGQLFDSDLATSSLPESDRQTLIKQNNDGTLFPIQRDSENSVIPYQLHLNELREIIARQSKYYPFLTNTFDEAGKPSNKIEALLKFRVPYFVGPLVEPTVMEAAGSGNPENHWMARKQDSTEPITPWNFSEQVDRDESGRKFISRLTGNDTYLLGEPTLPKQSLLYQEYEVLNELSNVRLEDRLGDHWTDRRRLRLDPEMKTRIVKELFMTRKTVTKKAVQNLIQKYTGEEVTLFGLADESKFLSGLTSWNDLRKVFGDRILTIPHQTLESIVEAQTVFEDKVSLRHQLSLIQGITNEDRDKLALRHYTGWGQFSKKLLTTRIATLNSGLLDGSQKHSIIEILRDTNLNFMEIVTDEASGIPDWINNENSSVTTPLSLEDVVADIPANPAIKRGIIQSVRVVDDVIRAKRRQLPARIYIEMADEVQQSHRTQSRLTHLNEIYNSKGLRKEFSDLTSELKKLTGQDIQDDRLYLYYSQLGKDMYSGEAIDPTRLSTDYDIDHIIPQAVTKNDSIDNRVLVKRIDNARKSDSFTYTPELIGKCLKFWERLQRLGLISRTKFDRLTRTDDFSTREKERFIERSLVQTRQILKHVANILRNRYGKDVEVISINSNQTKDMRRYLGFERKNRDINDYHHAQDALCIAAVGEFSRNRGFFEKGIITDKSLSTAMNSYNQYLTDYLRSIRHEAAGKKAERLNPYGFIVGSMRSSNLQNVTNPRTGEIVWSDADHDYLAHVMNFKKIRISYKVGDSYGALFDMNPLPASKIKGVGQPLKKFKNDTSLYGGYSGSQSAYSALVLEKNGKTRLIGIPRSIAASQEKTTVYLHSKGKVLFPHIHAGQLIVKDGALLQVKAATELTNAYQLWLDRDTYNKVHDLVSGNIRFSGDPDEEANKVFLTLMDTIEHRYPLYRVPEEKKTKATELFFSLPLEEKEKTLHQVLIGLHANSSNGDLKNIGLSNRWYRVHNQTGYTLQDSDEFIFQSVTGLFEKRVSVKELKSQLHESDI